MEKSYKKVAQLIYKYLSDNLNDQEWQSLQEWLAHSERNRKLFSRLTSDAYWQKTNKIKLKEQWLKVLQPYPAAQVRKLTIRPVYKWAACIIGLLLIGGYRWYKSTQNKTDQMTAYSNSPGERIANPLLLLANGSIIELDRLAAGPLARINGWQIRNRSMQVRFDQIPGSYLTGYNKQSYADWLYPRSNMIITPKGSSYSVKLSDGSEVTLNENSVLKFPSQFGDEQRVVEVSGEAYFKVKSYDAGRMGHKVPFIVSVNRTKVEVLGTEFNINAYGNSDSIRTTLVEGSVKVISDGTSRILKRGQEIVLNKKGEFTEPKVVNVNKVKAWKVSVKFENASIEEIMEHICRNFDVRVTYLNKITTRFDVTIPPADSLVNALSAVRVTGAVNFKIERKNVFVTQ